MEWGHALKISGCGGYFLRLRDDRPMRTSSSGKMPRRGILAWLSGRFPVRVLLSLDHLAGRA